MLYTSNNRLVQILATRKGASLSIAGVTIFMVILMLVIAILPAYRSITDQLKNNEVKLVYLNEMKQKREAMDKLNEEYSTNEGLIAKFEKYNSDAENSEVVLANITAIAQKYNCIVVSLNFQKADLTKNTNYSVFPGILEKQVQINVLGQLADLSLFLKDIEGLPLAINLKTIDYKHYVNIAGKIDLTKESLIVADPRFQLSIDGSYFIWLSNT